MTPQATFKDVCRAAARAGATVIDAVVPRYTVVAPRDHRWAGIECPQVILNLDAALTTPETDRRCEYVLQVINFGTEPWPWPTVEGILRSALDAGGNVVRGHRLPDYDIWRIEPPAGFVWERSRPGVLILPVGDDEDLQFTHNELAWIIEGGISPRRRRGRS